MKRPVPIVALDVPDAAAATRLVDALGDRCHYYKVGSELFTGAGPAILDLLHQRGASIFLDLKFHDIPNTVRGAVKSAARPGVSLMTVHASGGRDMLEAAVSAAPAGVGILAVTILTSLDGPSLGAAWGRTVSDVQAEVLRLAGDAASAGTHGVVCSGREAAAIGREFGGRLATLVPGVRLPGGDKGDQARVVTPREAMEAGASYIVLGRAVTGAASPRDAMERVLADLS